MWLLHKPRMGSVKDLFQLMNEGTYQYDDKFVQRAFEGQDLYSGLGKTFPAKECQNKTAKCI